MDAAELTPGVEFDGKTYVGDLVDSLKERTVGAVDKTEYALLNTKRGVYMPRWTDKKDDTIFICHDGIDIESLCEDLYNSDFGYRFSDTDSKTWTSVDGDLWLSTWTVCTKGEVQKTGASDQLENVTRALCTSLGSRERMSRSILIMPDEQLARLRSGNAGRVVLKKISRTHGKTIYTLVDKCDSPKDIGFIVVWPNGEKYKPPTLHVVRDVDARIFCIIIGDKLRDRFSSLKKETVHNSFTHYEGRIYKAKYKKRSKN